MYMVLIVSYRNNLKNAERKLSREVSRGIEQFHTTIVSSERDALSQSVWNSELQMSVKRVERKSRSPTGSETKGAVLANGKKTHTCFEPCRKGLPKKIREKRF